MYFVRVWYLRFTDKRSNDKGSNDKGSNDKGSNDKGSNDIGSKVRQRVKRQKVKMIKIFFDLNQFVHGSYILDMDIIYHVAAALGPLACPSRSAQPRKCLNLT